MREQTAVKTPQSDSPAATGLLQRKCACGQHTTDQHGQCTECNNKGQLLQRRAINQSGPEIAPPIVHEVLRSPGRPLDAATRADMEPRFGHDFSRVRVHTGAPMPFQAKLSINKPGDKYEQEADRIADQVMRMPEPAVQRQTVLEEEEEDETLQMKPLAAQITPLVQRETIDEEEEEEVAPANRGGGQAISLSMRNLEYREHNLPSEEPDAREYTGPTAVEARARKVPPPRYSPSPEQVKAEREAAKWWRLWREWMEYKENRPLSNLGIIEDLLQKADKAIKESPFKETIKMLLKAVTERKEKGGENKLKEYQDKLWKLLQEYEELMNLRRKEKEKMKGEVQRLALNEEELLAADRADAQVPTFTSSVEAAVQSGGQPLDAATRAIMEPRFGHDFSHVRVHTGPQAAVAAQTVNARAFTVGHDIVFGQGQYAPKVIAGQKLLAHELVHTVQQTARLTQSNRQNSLQRTPFERAERRSRRRERREERRARRRARRAVTFVEEQPFVIEGTSAEPQFEIAPEESQFPGPDCPVMDRPTGGSEIALIAGGFENLYEGDARAEITAAKDQRWLPSTEDFVAASQHFSGRLLMASNFTEFFGAIQDIEGPIQRIVVVAHGFPGAISLGRGQITENALNQWFNEREVLPGQEYLVIEEFRQRFANDATLDLYMCNGAVDDGLIQALSNWLCVCVRGFGGLIEWSLAWNAAEDRVIRCGTWVPPGTPYEPGAGCFSAPWRRGFDEAPPIKRCPNNVPLHE
jgi:hypothetical protein